MIEPDPTVEAALLGRAYKTLRLEWQADVAMLRIRTAVNPVPCYTLAALGELQQVLNDISTNPGQVRHLVLTSDVPGVFSFGGDLALFVLLVRAGDIDSLRMYGTKCVDLMWWLENAANLGVYTTVMSAGDTLGGGLESVLPFHRIIFEHSAKAGYPEVLFNLFPGMGAWCFTRRRAGHAVACDLILSGRVFSADELHMRRVIDMVVVDGEGERAIDYVVREVDPRHRGVIAALRAQRISAPIRRESLLEIVDQWVRSAMDLTDRDLRLMERLVRAQVRKAGGADTGVVDEIKRMELAVTWAAHRQMG